MTGKSQVKLSFEFQMVSPNFLVIQSDQNRLIHKWRQEGDTSKTPPVIFAFVFIFYFNKITRPAIEPTTASIDGRVKNRFVKGSTCLTV